MVRMSGIAARMNEKYAPCGIFIKVAMKKKKSMKMSDPAQQSLTGFISRKKMIVIMTAEISIEPETARPYADARFSEDRNSNMTTSSAISIIQLTASI